MTKTVTIDVRIEVRKTGPDLYQHGNPCGDWSVSRPESEWRSALDHFGARAIVQAIDSLAFAEPLPTAEGAHIRIPGIEVDFFHIPGVGTTEPWISSHMFKRRYWHTPEQVQSYGPFEVLHDPEKKEG